MTAIGIRPMESRDIETVRQIEVDAGEAFRSVGMDDIADDDPPSPAELEVYLAAGRAWVIESGEGTVSGYVLVDVLDGAAHLEQVSVHPDVRGKRLGQTLIDHVESWAREQRLDGVTLTTFRDVPWNAPYYERLGFRVLDEAELGPELAARRDEETAHGLDPMLRVCMVRSPWSD
jgi:GNAT superfamily N-acetyltransferase